MRNALTFLAIAVVMFAIVGAVWHARQVIPEPQPIPAPEAIEPQPAPVPVQHFEQWWSEHAKTCEQCRESRATADRAMCEEAFEKFKGFLKKPQPPPPAPATYSDRKVYAAPAQRKRWRPFQRLFGNRS